MASSVEDQDQRSNGGGLEDLTSMTIESLRAQLLSERAVSKSSRQRADDLAKRVLELEEQLKMVSLQRRKAEKATVDVLAILESNGISDASDSYYSNSDQETISDDSTKMKETSRNFEVRRSDIEAYSSSEIDSSHSTGRSLSWKSSKDSHHSFQRTKYMEPVRRRSSAFASNGTSSPKRVGKSCRRIRRREIRSATEQLQTDPNMHELQASTVDNFSKDSPICADIEHPASLGINNTTEIQVPGSSSPGTKGVNGLCSDGHAKHKDLDGTLQQQVDSLGQFEEEETAQRQWEDKVRENSVSGSILDSCDPGNRSDVTEERDDVKASDQSNVEASIRTQDLGNNEAIKPDFSVELQLKDMAISSTVDSTCLLDQKETGSHVASESVKLSSKENQNQVVLENTERVPPQSSHISTISNGSLGISSAHNPVSSENGESSGINKELALVSQNSSSNVESVLQALQLARSSLNQKINNMPLLENGSSVNSVERSVLGARTRERMEIPVGCPGLFRLPTDFQFEATVRSNSLGSNSRPVLSNGYHEATFEGFLGSPYEESRSSASLSDQFYGSSPSPSREIQSGVNRTTLTPPFPQGVSGLHASTMPRLGMQPSGSPMRLADGNVFDTGVSSSSTSSYLDHRMDPGFVTRLPASSMPFMESGIHQMKPVHQNAFVTSPSSGRSSYLDPQMNPGLVLPRRYTSPSYPFYPEVAQQVPSNDRFARNVASQEYNVPSNSGFSFYDDPNVKQNMYK
ncbi:OLC1v1026257C7 [Oldenlandia corymbosa var. corymbosa]|uniref:OLC1v1026257C7 n=1 Tax=Oldenlandia corymbosa var. corymbosa TaxID=529605 RepID=A0AAV1C6Y7_OLDCO|nr:OLC1v1026257C7 [Oldenlandia corymbosa var. corymbosa]